MDALTQALKTDSLRDLEARRPGRRPVQRAVARLSRHVGQSDDSLANPIMSREAERRTGPGKIWPAATEHDRVQVDPILVDQAKFGQALRQVRAGNFDLSVALRLELT